MPVAAEPAVVIIGAGPAGLTAAYELTLHDCPSVVLEKSGALGGLARTAEYRGYLFDIGGHRFFTKVPLIEKIWRDVLGDDLLTRPRLSRIYYQSKFFRYPLEPWEALRKLGPWEALLCGLSYARAQLFPRRPEDTFDSWVSNRFGRRLFEIFFRSYTEKVWGMPCDCIRAEWAAQRIRGLSLSSLILDSLRRPGNPQQAVKSLIHEFYYPRLGPGMLWSKMRDIIEQRQARIVFHAPVERIVWEPGAVKSVVAGGRSYAAKHFISTMPIRELIRKLDPAPPPTLRRAADDFHYRDFLAVALIFRGVSLFPDNWIYVHEPNVRVGRIQNYKNWSPEMVPDVETTCLGLEYFCSEGDDLWSLPDADLIELGRREVASLGLAPADSFLDGTVLRISKAYPVYDDTYQRGLAEIRRFLETVPNLQLVGRNGMHRYNNQDHSMLTGILAARNTLGRNYDLWEASVDHEFLEEGEPVTDEQLEALEKSQPLIPRKVARSAQS